ncbi:hypothetical protein AGMMS49975_24290 [Clostridia bacterium]|nr:hypothetical protein AGMMS49975_24290 [Clostridia bacterium]
MEYLNLSKIGANEINKEIKNRLSRGKNLTITGTNSANNICAGLCADAEIIIDDSTGLYTASYLENAKITVTGSVGWYAGDDMMSGELVVMKNAGCNVGAYICGGGIVIRKNAGSRVGYGMKGGNIIVCGNVCRFAAQMAMGGRLIVLGGAGQEIGASMFGGAVFLRDSDAKNNLGANAEYGETTAEEREEIGLLFEKYEIAANPNELGVVRPKKTNRDAYKIFEPRLDFAGKKFKGGVSL